MKCIYRMTIIPKLTIVDLDKVSQWRFRYYDKNTKKYKYVMRRYGKRNSKEEAYEAIVNARNELIDKYRK